MFENEKIKNGLKSFFSDLKEGEPFSLVHLGIFLVHEDANFDNCHIGLFTWVCDLTFCIYSLYKTIFSTFALVYCILADAFCIFGQCSCQFASINCAGGL